MFSFARTKHDYVKPLTSISNALSGKRQGDVVHKRWASESNSPFSDSCVIYCKLGKLPGLF